METYFKFLTYSELPGDAFNEWLGLFCVYYILAIPRDGLHINCINSSNSITGGGKYVYFHQYMNP